MTPYFVGGALVCVAVAGWATWMDWRRGKRANLDKVGWISWPLVLVLALVAAMMLTLLAFAA